MVVLVDGLGRTGKSMLSAILASFDRVEIERLEEILEYIGALHGMGKITGDAAVAMLRMETDFHVYNSMIGRNTNFRFRDHSSVWKNPNRVRYLKRLAAPDGDAAVQAIYQDRPIYQNMTHDQLTNFEILYEAFGTDLRIIEMIRHPIELAASWIRRGTDTRLSTDPRAFVLCVRYQDQDLPYYVSGWEDIYLSASPAGRVVRMIQSLWDRNLAVLHSLTETQRKQNIFVVPFERFVQQPTPYVHALGEFIGSHTTRHTGSALRRQNCPREYVGDVTQKRELIDRQISGEEQAILQRLVEEYETLAAKSGL